ncbi:YqaJ viral recombinase family protein [Clostridium botulinum]|uniref:YqaJ viral recombinase family nuclease n=1 Tax=Clostridium botulinum TaxID=1491 RepID=UPI00249ECA95|nr:YqaJ viral recombinase family protein [Clostridium botulinum]MDU4596495.1 YqaJ viral recombinase family protein [Clostridium sporogenes]
MENVVYANEPQVDLKQWLKERRKGVSDGKKFVKRYYGLDCDLLIKTTDLSHSDWLEARKLGITGTDLGGLTGVSKYSTPIKIYLDKIGELEPTEDNEAMYWGRIMEDVIAKDFQSRNDNMKVNRVNAILKHPEYEWALGNIDRLITNDNGEKGILEIKTVSEYIKTAWEGEEVPPQYMVQLQWYMFVAGVKFGYFAALIGGNKYIQKYVERDEELIEILKNIAQNFWENNVLTKTPPLIDGSDASTDLLKTLYPNSEAGTEIELPDEALKLIESREDLKGQKKELDSQISECENKLKDLLKENEVGICGERKVTWKTYARTSIDSKKLKYEKPELFKEYSKTSSYRKFDIK